MNEKTYTVEQVAKTKQQWLIFLIMSAIFGLVLDYLGFGLNKLLNVNHSAYWPYYILPLTIFINYIKIHCAYKKNGTRLLMLDIIMEMLSSIITFTFLCLSIIKYPQKFLEIINLPLSLSNLFILAGAAICLYGLKLSFQLWSVNKFLQKQM